MKLLVTVCLWCCALSVNSQQLIVLSPLNDSFLASPPTRDPDLMLLYKVLSSYPDQISMTEMSWTRAETEVVHQPFSCIPVRKTADRQRYLNFSLPYKVLSEPKLVIRKDSKHRAAVEQLYHKDGNVSLAALLSADTRPVLGVDQTRSYGSQIDELIKTFKSSNSIYVKANVMKVTAGSIPMLLKGHVDMVVEYLMSIEDHSQIMAFPLAETDRFVPLYFGCSKSTQGGQQLALINQTILALAHNLQYQQLMLNVLEPQDRPYAIAHWHSLLSVSEMPSR